MLLTISTTHHPATDLGHLLHKHPNRFQTFDVSFGRVHCFFPVASEEFCSACLLLDVDPIRLVRRKDPRAFSLGQYVNDRPYVASSMLSVAISQVFGSALQGRSKERPLLAEIPIPLSARIDVLPVRGGEKWLRALFGPLGYRLTCERHALDARFPEWGDSPFWTVELTAAVRLADLLSHLYVLVPVFDNAKHYYIGDDELEKLLAKGKDWLSTHPEKETIARRYLKHRASLYREALARLADESESLDDEEPSGAKEAEEHLEQPLTLNEQRLSAVLSQIQAAGAASVIDLGCGEGKLLRELAHEPGLRGIVGLDASIRALEVARERVERLPQRLRPEGRIRLLHGALTYRDERMDGFDVATVVEVVEHLDPPRLIAFERVLFECARPKTVIVTTPNREYNGLWESLGPDRLRHPDHRFEWTRQEFIDWSASVAKRFDYAVRFQPIGPESPDVGSPTQMAVFERSA